MARIKGITDREYEQWLAFCEQVQLTTSYRLHEKRHEREARIKHLLKPENYGEFFMYYFPNYCDDGKTKCARYQVRNAVRLHEMREEITLLQIHHRQSAKSTHANMGYPLHLMFNDDLWFGVIMGYNEKKAARLLKDAQAQLKNNHRIINDFGVQFSHGDWAEGSFVTTKGVAYESLSYIQDPAGFREGANRPDYANVDDVDNRKKARNKVLVREAVDNIISNLSEALRFDRQRLVVSNNRKVKGGIVDTIIEDIGKKPSTVISLVNAVDKKGRSTWPERYSDKYWEKKKANKTYRVWEREYMNNPVEDGYIFKPEWIRYKKPLPYAQYERLVLYGDLSYTDSGDLKSLHLIGKIGREFHVLQAFNRQTSMDVAVKWAYDLAEDLNLSTSKYSLKDKSEKRKEAEKARKNAEYFEGLKESLTTQFYQHTDEELKKKSAFAMMEADHHLKAAKEELKGLNRDLGNIGQISHGGGIDVKYMIEANFIQNQFLNDFDLEGDIRGYYLPISGDMRQKGNKFDRIENNLVPLFSRGFVYLNEDLKKDEDMLVLKDCLLAFEKGSGAPDDPPDSIEGGIYELNRQASNKVERIRVIKRENNFID